MALIALIIQPVMAVYTEEGLPDDGLVHVMDEEPDNLVRAGEPGEAVILEDGGLISPPSLWEQLINFFKNLFHLN